MTPSRSADDLRARLRSAAAGGARTQDDGGGEKNHSAGSPLRPRRVRITVDLDRDDHKALRRWVAEEETDGQAVIRALLAEMFRDQRLAARVRKQVGGTRFR